MATPSTFERSVTSAREEAAPSPRGSRAGLIPLLALVFAGGLAMFVSIEPTQPWILLVLTALLGLGADGVLRAHPRGEFRTVADTSPYLFVPVLFALSAGLFLEDVVLGYWAAPSVAGAAVLMAATLYAEHVSVQPEHRYFPQARFVLNAVTYLTAFGFYAAVYGFEVDLLPAAFAVGLVSMLLSVEVFREAEPDSIRGLAFAAVIGIIAAEARWVLYFLPLDDFLAGIFILLAFYLATGVISHYLTEDLRGGVLVEFMVVAAAGLAIISAGRVYGN